MNSQYLTKTELAKRWSQNLIDFYFPEPTLEKPNPRHKRGAPMQLYDINMVKRIEATNTFKNDFKDVAKHKIAGLERAKKKREELMMYANGVRINIPNDKKDKLIQKACDHYNCRNSWKEWENFNYTKASPSSDESFLKRITINYLRHQCTTYDEELRKFFKKVGGSKAHDILQKRINEAIKQKYEWLR